MSMFESHNLFVHMLKDLKDFGISQMNAFLMLLQ